MAFAPMSGKDLLFLCMQGRDRSPDAASNTPGSDYIADGINGLWKDIMRMSDEDRKEYILDNYKDCEIVIILEKGERNSEKVRVIEKLFADVNIPCRMVDTATMLQIIHDLRS